MFSFINHRKTNIFNIQNNFTHFFWFGFSFVVADIIFINIFRSETHKRELKHTRKNIDK